MTTAPSKPFSKSNIIAAWLVHIFTVFGAILCLFALERISQHSYITAFWLMGFAILVDATDGTLARRYHVKTILPNFDGALLDNIIDYMNYVFVPSYLLLIADIVPAGLRAICACAILLASAYQFCQSDAKTKDYFFKGFPSYWNIAIFYLFFWQSPQWLNTAIILLLAAGVFIPIKYVYPSRMQYLTPHRWLRTTIFIGTIVWGVATFGLLWTYPDKNMVFVFISMGYAVIYFLMSFYRTLRPLK